eukprot:scaffold30032_cov138-Isochrysis_galbana.AAC.5
MMTQLPVSLMVSAAEVTHLSSFGAETWNRTPRCPSPLLSPSHATQSAPTPWPTAHPAFATAPELSIALRSNWSRRGARSCLQRRGGLVASTSRVSVQPSSFGKSSLGVWATRAS